MYCVNCCTQYEDNNNGWIRVLIVLPPSQDGVTALMIASHQGHLSVVRVLYQAGATINTTTEVRFYMYQMVGSC